MEEPLLANRAMIDEANQRKEGDLGQGNGCSSETQHAILSALVALCGSLCFGCIVSPATYYS